MKRLIFKEARTLREVVVFCNRFSTLNGLVIVEHTNGRMDYYSCIGTVKVTTHVR